MIGYNLQLNIIALDIFKGNSGFRFQTFYKHVHLLIKDTVSQLAVQSVEGVVCKFLLIQQPQRAKEYQGQCACISGHLGRGQDNL